MMYRIFTALLFLICLAAIDTIIARLALTTKNPHEPMYWIGLAAASILFIAAWVPLVTDAVKKSRGQQA